MRGCGCLLVVILALPTLAISVVAYFLGVELLAGVGAEVTMRTFEEPIVRVLFGVTMVVLAAWGTLRVYRRRRLPVVTPLAVVAWVVTAFILVSLGAVALVSVVTNEPSAQSF